MQTSLQRSDLFKLHIMAVILIVSLLFTPGGNAGAQNTPVKNIVLVHGAFADGSGWKGVYDILTKKAIMSASYKILLPLWLQTSLQPIV